MNCLEVDVGVAGMGFYFPQNQVDTKAEAERAQLPDKVYDGIGVDRIYKPSETDHPSQMAFEASVKALHEAGITADQVDLIVTTGFLRDYLFWQMGAVLKARLGAVRATTMEVTGGCATFFQAVEFAVAQIRACLGINTVIVAAGDRLFGYAWPSFLSSGGQAIVIRRECQQFKYLGFATSNLIRHHNVGCIPHGGTNSPFTATTDWKDGSFVENFQINKTEYYEHVKPVVFDKFVEVTRTLLGHTGHKLEHISYLVTLVQQRDFAQRIVNALGIPNLPHSGEYSRNLGHFNGADPYIHLDRARRDGKIKKGDIILKLGFGGIAWFASLIRY